MKSLIPALVMTAVIGGVLWYHWSKEVPSVKYENGELGFSMIYPESWITIKQAKVEKLLARADKVLEVSSDVVEGVQDMLPLMVLALVKEKSGGGLGCNFNLFAIPLSEEEIDLVKSGDAGPILEAQIEDIKASFPNAEVSLGAFPLPDHPEIANFFFQLKVRNQLVKHYQYLYLRGGVLVHFSFSWVEAGDEREIKKIIETISIQNDLDDDDGRGDAPPSDE